MAKYTRAVFEKKLGNFFHTTNLEIVMGQFTLLVNRGLTEVEAFTVVCSVFDAARAEYID